MVRSRSEADAPAITFKGRRFAPEEIGLIKELVATFRKLSRQELANTVCELVDWRRPNRGLKTWEARDLLEELERTGQIKLPAPTSMGRPRGSKTSVPHTERGEMQPEMVASISDVEPVTMRLVQTPEDRRLWRELVGRYHPDGHRVPVGAHLRYLVEIARTTWGCPVPRGEASRLPRTRPRCDWRIQRSGRAPALEAPPAPRASVASRDPVCPLLPCRCPATNRSPAGWKFQPAFRSSTRTMEDPPVNYPIIIYLFFH